MLKNNRIVALLTGRGNNTLKDKNVLPIHGKPLCYWPSIAAKKAGCFTDFYVSSDDEKILNVAGELGYKSIKRPAALALPTSLHVDALVHALEVMRKQDALIPDILVVFLANTGTVKPDWISESVKTLLEDETVSAVVPAKMGLDNHPFRAKKITDEGFLETFFDFTGKQISSNRQDLPKCCFLCHNFWALRVENFQNLSAGQQPWTFMGNRIRPLLIDEAFDVHDMEDIRRTEKWLTENNLC